MFFHLNTKIKEHEIFLEKLALHKEPKKLYVADKTFDFVIIGGGTAGLTLAARLTEDVRLSVVVLEAGLANLNDPNILIPAQYGKTFFNPKYDWSFWTTPQKHCNDRALYWPRGKGLGGSSALNFLGWVYPPAADIDAIEKLGNPGWNWASYKACIKRVEAFHAPTPEQLDLYPITFLPENHGTHGSVETSFPHFVRTLDAPFHETFSSLGVKHVEDAFDGDITGAWISTNSIDPKTHTRSYATTAHYLPNQGRKNLTVLTEAAGARVLFGSAIDGEELTATGVEFVFEGKTHVVYSRREVILSSGTIKNPQILELSGIGRPDVLSSLGIDVQIAVPGVGENVQEHLHTGVSFELSENIQHTESYDMMRDPAYAAEQLRLHAEGRGLHRLGVASVAYLPLSFVSSDQTPALISSLAQVLEEKRDTFPPGLGEQFDLQLDILRDDALPDLEIALFPGHNTMLTTPEPDKKHVTLVPVLNHPFSRGTIHAKSKDPLDNPEIDPHVFENDFDLENLVQQVKLVRTLQRTEPFKSLVARELEPGPECISDEHIRDFIKKTVGTTWHTVGSCSMLPREKQGVVDPTLKVYGTKNLRVVDISIIPLHIAAHTQATAYVIGEKAADIIRGSLQQ